MDFREHRMESGTPEINAAVAVVDFNLEWCKAVPFGSVCQGLFFCAVGKYVWL
jgi:hypothetical protein